ncbi:MAG TPA: SgcJ/EcaC family oxidoreductase [Oceanobacillus sp.]|nr:SgcJ/EcaC family oxidoreductase [Oceanobacillus sp.]
MNSQGSIHADEAAVCALYHRLLDCWNRRCATDFAHLFANDGSVVAFDGSQINGQAEISQHLRQIFADEPPAAYVGKIKDVRLLTHGAGMVRAVVGTIPPGQSRLNPETNAIQSMIAEKRNGKWRVVHFQNTPAQFRPDLLEALTDELQLLL